MRLPCNRSAIAEPSDNTVRTIIFIVDINTVNMSEFSPWLRQQIHLNKAGTRSFRATVKSVDASQKTLRTTAYMKEF